MVGGSLNAFIGAIHRKAANLDGEIELVCGAFSSNAEKSKATGEALYLNPHRTYASFEEMIRKERELPGDLRMDFVSIVTPNHLHFAPAKMALEHGFHVIIDKPLAFNLAEAKSLNKIVKKTGLVFALTHTYTGYPMVKEARNMAMTGVIGKIRKVYVEYPQGWLSTFLESTGQKQASWRTDPEKSGSGGAIGDIGTHAANLAEYIISSNISEICASLNIVVKGRRLDDDSSMLLKFDNGATGTLLATQVAAGDENNLNIRVYGEKGGLEWKQEEPNSLIVKWLDKPREIYRAGWSYLSDSAKKNIRTPNGHPEGYLEAFANIYLEAFRAIAAEVAGKRLPAHPDFPTINDGVLGMAFIEAVVKSARRGARWVRFPQV